MLIRRLTLTTLCLVAAIAPTQSAHRSTQIPGFTVPDEPKNITPKESEFRDGKYKLHFHLPAGWDIARKDGILSNFGTDTRTARKGLEVRGVAALNYNPYPPTTFSGALFYYSVLPHATADTCSSQTSKAPMKSAGAITIDGVTFQHGHDQHGAMQCIESRVDAFTTLRGNTCVRFDLVINTFCGSTSGSIDVGPQQLGDIQTRLANILGSVRFDKK
jgi:hypothetical protein